MLECANQVLTVLTWLEVEVRQTSAGRLDSKPKLGARFGRALVSAVRFWGFRMDSRYAAFEVSRSPSSRATVARKLCGLRGFGSYPFAPNVKGECTLPSADAG